jgi:MFS family permease
MSREKESVCHWGGIQTYGIEINEEFTEQTNINTLAPNQVDPLSWPKLIFLLIGLSVIIFVSSLDQTIVATAIPSIISEFNSLVDVSWAGSAGLLTTAAVTPLCGKLTTIFGLRNVFVFVIVMFLIGSLGCALSTNMVMLIAFRGLAGIGGESMFALSIVVINGRIMDHCDNMRDFIY